MPAAQHPRRRGSAEAVDQAACWSLAHGRLNPFRCRVELSAVTRLEHEVDCACGCRRIDILQPCPVGSPPPTGPGGARRSHDHRTDQRHPVKSFPIGAPMPVSPTRAQARSAESVDQADNERHERPDCATRNEPASRAAPCRRPYRPGCRAESPDPFTRPGSCRCRPRECARLPSAHRGAPPLAAHPNGATTTATATCTDPDAMQPPTPCGWILWILTKSGRPAKIRCVVPVAGIRMRG